MDPYYRFEGKKVVKNNRKDGIPSTSHKDNTSAILQSQAQNLEAEEVSELSL